MSQHVLIVRYVVSGCIGIAIQTLTLIAWVDFLNLRDQYLWGAAIGLILSVVVTFILQKYWTFRDALHSRAPRQLLMYSIIAISSLILNTMLLHISKVTFDWLGLSFFHLWYVAVGLMIQFFVAFLSFLANRLITFER